MKTSKLYPLIDIKVKEFMTTTLLTLHPKDKIERAREIFDQYDLHHIPIVKMEKLVGIVSLGDLLFQAGTLNKKKHSAIPILIDTSILMEDIMTENPIFLQTNHSLNDVIELMMSKRINAIPIVENEQLLGMITTFDVIKLLGNKN